MTRLIKNLMSELKVWSAEDFCELTQLLCTVRVCECVTARLESEAAHLSQGHSAVVTATLWTEQ